MGVTGLEPGTTKVYHDIISSLGEIANVSPPSWARIVPAEVYVPYNDGTQTLRIRVSIVPNSNLF